MNLDIGLCVDCCSEVPIDALCDLTATFFFDGGEQCEEVECCCCQECCKCEDWRNG